MKARFFLARVARFPDGSFTIENIQSNHGTIAAWFDRHGRPQACEYRPSEAQIKIDSPAWKAVAEVGRRQAARIA